MWNRLDQVHLLATTSKALQDRIIEGTADRDGRSGQLLDAKMKDPVPTTFWEGRFACFWGRFGEGRGSKAFYLPRSAARGPAVLCTCLFKVFRCCGFGPKYFFVDGLYTKRMIAFSMSGFVTSELEKTARLRSCGGFLEQMTIKLLRSAWWGPKLPSHTTERRCLLRYQYPSCGGVAFQKVSTCAAHGIDLRRPPHSFLGRRTEENRQSCMKGLGNYKSGYTKHIHHKMKGKMENKHVMSSYVPSFWSSGHEIILFI